MRLGSGLNAPGGGRFAAVGMVCGEIMTSPGFCRNR